LVEALSLADGDAEERPQQQRQLKKEAVLKMRCEEL